MAAEHDFPQGDERVPGRVGTELYGAVRSGLATGRLHGLSALGALGATLEGRSLLLAPAAEEPGQAPSGRPSSWLQSCPPRFGGVGEQLLLRRILGADRRVR